MTVPTDDVTGTATDSGLGLLLAKRLHQALTAGKEALFGLLQDPDMEVLRTLLKNRSLDDQHLLVLLRRRDLSEELLKAIASLQRVTESHELKVALARNVGTPATVLSALLPHLYLFELMNLCRLPGLTQDLKTSAERILIQRIPAAPLGNKLALARQGTPLILEKLLKEGDPKLVATCLDNPRTREAAVHSFLGSAAASPETISIVARHQGWKERPNIRLAILKNGKTPLVWYPLLLPRMKLHELKDLLLTPRLMPQQKQLVEQELVKRKS
jgi:hypothetical protein